MCDAATDFNRDGAIDSLDYAAARANQGRSLPTLTAPAAAAAASAPIKPTRTPTPRRSAWETLQSEERQ